MKKKPKLVNNHLRNRLNHLFMGSGNTSFPCILSHLSPSRPSPVLTLARSCLSKGGTEFSTILLSYMIVIFYPFFYPSTFYRIPIPPLSSAFLCGYSPSSSPFPPSLGVRPGIPIFYFSATWRHLNKNRRRWKREYFWFRLVFVMGRWKVGVGDIWGGRIWTFCGYSSFFIFWVVFRCYWSGDFLIFLWTIWHFW